MGLRDGFEVNYLSCLIHEVSVSSSVAALQEIGFSAVANLVEFTEAFDLSRRNPSLGAYPF